MKTVKDILLAYFKIEFESQFEDSNFEIDESTAKQKRFYGFEIISDHIYGNSYYLEAQVLTTADVETSGDNIREKKYTEYHNLHHEVIDINSDVKITNAELENILNS